MSLKSTNPTKTNSWNKLRDHFNDIKGIHIDAMFTDNIFVDFFKFFKQIPC